MSVSPLRLTFLASLLLTAWVGPGCSSSSTPSSDAAVGGAVTGALDDHCSGVAPVVVSQASCHPADAGATEADGGVDEESPILYNAEGDDDDCKYHVSFTAMGVQLNKNATLEVTATKLADHTPATGADIVIESYLADSALHPLPNGVKAAVESAGGKYSIAPVKFDASGRWIVRFHLYEDCEDLLPDSPHGHVAFYVDVP
jgi:hypothetical protein